MKKKIKRHLFASLLMIFLLYLLLGQITQMIILQRHRLKESWEMIDQLEELAKQEDLQDDGAEVLWDTVYALSVTDFDMMILSADASTGEIFRSTDETLVGKTLSELGVPEKMYRMQGEASYETIGHTLYYGMFYTREGVIYGRFQDVVDTCRFLRSSLLIQALAALVILAVFTARTMQYVNGYIARPLTEMSRQTEQLASGDLETQFPARKNDLSEVQQIYGSMDRIREHMAELADRQEKQEQLLAMETERADSAHAAKKVFLSKISHDIRTPMNGILGMTAIAGANIDDRERVRDALGKIDDSGKQLLAMLDDVLDMSRIESGRADLQEENFQLADLINQTMEELRPLVNSRSHQLTLEVKGLIHEHVVGSPERVASIFKNMIENAVKYTPKGGKIRVAISELDSDIRYMGKYCFVFEDNGIGMSQEAVAHIFEPFERASDDDRTVTVKGMGLGLSIVKNIVQLMNGTIQVESQPEVGSKFTVTICLKLQKRAEGVATHMERNEVRLEDFRKENYSDKRVLVVEDNELSGEIAAEVLSMTGIEVEQARNGQQAVFRMTEVPEHYFDLILMDIQMPVMDGYIATRMIRNLKREDAKEIPIVAMTALASGEDVDASRAAGMDDHITKPLELERLKEILMKYL